MFPLKKENASLEFDTGKHICACAQNNIVSLNLKKIPISTIYWGKNVIITIKEYVS